MHFVLTGPISIHAMIGPEVNLFRRHLVYFPVSLINGDTGQPCTVVLSGKKAFSFQQGC